MKSDYLKPEIYQKLAKIMQVENILALRVSLETGLRIDDVLSLKWDNFISQRTFVYTAKKTKKQGKKSISLQLLNEIRKNSLENSPFLFPGRNPNSHRTRQAVWKDIKKASDTIGLIQNASPHSARKTYAVELRKQKGLDAVQTELQHTDITTTMLYAFSDIVKNNISSQQKKKNISPIETKNFNDEIYKSLIYEISKNVIENLRNFVKEEILPEIIAEIRSKKKNDA